MATANVTIDTPYASDFDIERQREITNRQVDRHSFCTLATTSAELRPHVSGVRYVRIGGAFYMTMHDDSVKARNIRQNPRVAVCIPVKKFPFVPPYAIQFQGTAELLPNTDARIVDLFEAGRLKGIISAKDFADPGTCFARIEPGSRVSTYGIGFSLIQIARNPTAAIRSFTW
jgi:hypothetical protein